MADKGVIRMNFERYKELSTSDMNLSDLKEMRQIGDWLMSLSSKEVASTIGSENAVWLYQRILWIE